MLNSSILCAHHEVPTNHRQVLDICVCQVHAKILSAGWSLDGLHLALGFFDGNVGIRDVNGVEKVTITRCVTMDTGAFS